MGDMMPTVYSPDESCEGRPCMEPDPYGGWVSLDDYAALRAERDALRDDLKALDAIVTKAEHDLRGVGGYDNELIGVPAGGVRSILGKCRAILARVAGEESP